MALLLSRNNRDAARSQAALFGFVKRADGVHDDPVDVFSHQRIDIVPLPFGIEIAVAKHDVDARGIGGIFGAARHFGKERVTNIAQDQAQDVGTAGDEAASEPIGAVVQPGGSLEHTLAGEPVHAVTVVQRARSRSNGDSGGLSDVSQFYYFGGGGGSAILQTLPIMPDWPATVACP